MCRSIYVLETWTFPTFSMFYGITPDLIPYPSLLQVDGPHTLTGDVVRDNDMLELWWLDVDITISSNNQLNRLQLQWIISTLPFTLLMIAKWVFQPLQVLVMVRAIHSAIWANKFSLVASLLSACHSRKQDISIFYWDLKKCITLFKSLVEDNVKEDYADLRKTPQCEIQK